ncbi:zinc metallochaperone AztD [Pseudonocardia nigra]|uniref:zinc metallochaperone AztD n=1 Tax=Pseudonocardia nigra TaxID=1921578 RepID=UPI001C602B41|nr:zinc metallochaperone AztD [Pseudonocardia nigra]
MALSLRGPRSAKVVALSAVTVGALALGACGTGAGEAPASPRPAAEAEQAVADPVVATYDGGLYVLDGSTLQVAEDIPLEGFNRINPAGDDRHVLVSTSTGFQVLDAVGARLTDVEFPAAEPGHVVRHAGRTVLFADGTGEVTIVDPATFGEAAPSTETFTTPEAHHGVAVELANGELVTTLGNEEERPGIVVLDENRAEIARNDDCPGVHGEATAQGEAVVIGCETGVLIYSGGTITKVTSPTPYGRIGNQAGSDASPITLGDYKQDEQAELERPTQISLVDTAAASLRLVDIGTSYTFRSLARGPQGEGLVLGTDGAIHVIDPVAGAVVRTIPVIEPWQEPLEWQQPRPAIFVRGGTAYVSEPAANAIHAVDLATGTTTATGTLPATPNELSGVSPATDRG